MKYVPIPLYYYRKATLSQYNIRPSSAMHLARYVTCRHFIVSIELGIVDSERVVLQPVGRVHALHWHTATLRRTGVIYTVDTL